MEDAPKAESFFASRWTTGNRIFPTHIEVSPERVARIKPRFLGSTEESITIPNVASVQIETGIWRAGRPASG